MLDIQRYNMEAPSGNDRPSSIKQLKNFVLPCWTKETSPIRVHHRTWCCALRCYRHFHQSKDVGGLTQATVHLPAQSRDHVLRNHVAVRTACDEHWALDLRTWRTNVTSSRRVLGHVVSINIGIQFVGLCFLALRRVLLLPLIMVSLSWNCDATVTDVSQML